MTIIDEYRSQIKVLEKKISDIQDSCSHPGPAVQILRRWNAGDEWSRIDDYRQELQCQLCTKRWTEPQ